MDLIVLVTTAVGIILCSTLTYIDVWQLPMPCSTQVCALLQSDPIAHPFGIPLSSVGLIYYFVLMVLALQWQMMRRPIALGSATALSTLGGFISAGLIYYAYQKTHSFCPWCLGSATCCFILAMAWCGTSNSPQAARSIRFVAGALGIGLCAGVLVGFRLSRAPSELSVNAAGLRAMPLEDLARSDRAVGRRSLTAHHFQVLVVDLSCGACRETLRRLDQLGDLPTALRFRPPITEYSREAALLVLDAPDRVSRNEALSQILADDSRTVPPLVDIRSRLHLSRTASPSALRRLQQDIQFCDALGISGTPVLIDVEGDRRQSRSPFPSLSEN